MDGIKIEVSGNIARVIDRPARITAGTVGLPVEFSFDSQWEGLIKTAVFKAGDESQIAENLVTKTVVPWEILDKPGLYLDIGVYGVNPDGTLAIATIWVNVGVIRDGANLAGVSITPTLPIWKQLSMAIGNLPGLTTNAKDNIVEAINEIHNMVLAVGAETEPTPTEAGNTTEANAHADDKNNPHNVTASQVGARPDTWMPTAEDVGALSSKWIARDAAANGTLADALTISADAADGADNVPKLVTAGVTANIPTNCQFGIRTAEWYSSNNILCRILGVNTSGMPTIWANHHDTTKGTWTGWMQPDMVQESDGCYYRLVDDGSAWPAIEWINPPMHPNVEYRTTERWKGKPVYCKVIETAEIPASSGTKRVELGIDYSKVVRYHCFASNVTNINSLPYADSSGNSLTVRILGTGLFFVASSDAFSGYTATITLYYVK
jgi:hypothetical protein